VPDYLAVYESITHHIAPLRLKKQEAYGEIILARWPYRFNTDIKYKSATPMKLIKDSKAGLITIKQFNKQQ